MKRTASLLVLAILLITGTSTDAFAKRHAAAPQATACDLFDVMRPCAGPWAGFGVPEAQRVPHKRQGTVLGGRPAGCPHRYCGCGLSLHFFGRVVPGLSLAINWARKFPLAAPAPRMAAVRPGHVMGLESHVEGSLWLVYDANSGGGLTRLHVRDIRGYSIHNPHA